MSEHAAQNIKTPCLQSNQPINMARIPPIAAMDDGRIPEDDGTSGTEGDSGDGSEFADSSGDGTGSSETAFTESFGTTVHLDFLPSQSHVHLTSLTLVEVPREGISCLQDLLGQVRHCPSRQIWPLLPPKTKSSARADLATARRRQRHNAFFNISSNL